MFPFHIESGALIALAAFAIPIVAITGGLVMGIVRTLGRQRMMELAQRERIASIERGVDVSKLQPIDLSALDGRDSWGGDDRCSSPSRRAQGLLIGGLVTLFAGIGIALFFGLLLGGHEGEEGHLWAIGLIPVLVGIALLISAKIVWPKAGDTPR